MGILSDRQIEAEGIVTNGFFKREYTKQTNVISAGLGSYGYDCRIGYKFKVFKPYPCLVIDPKNFDERAFEHVDLTPRPSELDPPNGLGQPENFITIPPNSFILGECLEEFKIPRDVLCVVVGKSTYARCFSGDTRLLLADGTDQSFVEMCKHPKKRRWSYGINIENGRYEMTEIVQPRFVGREVLLEVELDDGQKIKCTPDHEFLRHGGFYTPASELQKGDGIVPLYQERFRQRKMIWVPALSQWLPSHWLADLWNLKHRIYSETKDCHRHHRDENKENDNPTNIERVPISKHIKDHNAVYYGEGFDPSLHGMLIKAALALKAQDPDWCETVREMNSKKGKKLWTDPAFVEQRRKIMEALRKSWNTERARQAKDRMSEYNETVTFADRQKRWTPERRRKQAEVMRRSNQTMGKGNHSVVKIRELPGLHDVFCATSLDTGNFALTQGVIAKNCGLIVNVTPGEPEWKGKWTIEISNTTPLPAKVYCGEGVMQCLFFRSDEKRVALEEGITNLIHHMTYEAFDADTTPNEIQNHLENLLRNASCETSYADKKGKYQDATGIDIPKVIPEQGG